MNVEDLLKSALSRPAFGPPMAGSDLTHPLGKKVRVRIDRECVVGVSYCDGIEGIHDHLQLRVVDYRNHRFPLQNLAPVGHTTFSSTTPRRIPTRICGDLQTHMKEWGYFRT